MEKIIEVKDLTLTYPGADKSTLDALNLDINRGEIMTVIGKSGCGKSTLLNTIAGYLQPTSGEVLLNGEPITGPNWKLGVVFQNNALYPWLNVSDNIGFGLKMRHFDKSKIESRVSTLLDQVQLADKKDDYVFSLSGGMRQRVAIARALANQPQVVMFDESFGALDEFTRNDIHNVVLDLWKSLHLTFFIITHDIDEAIKLGNRIAIMTPDKGIPIKVIDNPYFNIDSAKIDAEYMKYKNDILEQIV
ncbi:ABC transporter ATP-binding protein [Companilactobacillus nodensis]|uniref:Nitrate transport ATP-binding protein nrtD n=1 Tax=Companilactobacillus nodensis DSM 19682 = JCM 14932 = NBRC 107160 TaxID=1423775 RepID=A0A0R1K7C8_9LACO|nr:ABC transporter ATP-binding protein [Companilactobacillus nodensis]KRK79227.1 nitrate transport ATP-binding protein nrtD [Companilactobacillus nodensis DSM 19682 = JCM 14932 = NBRC 107160]